MLHLLDVEECGDLIMGLGADDCGIDHLRVDESGAVLLAQHPERGLADARKRREHERRIDVDRTDVHTEINTLTRARGPRRGYLS